MNGNSAEQLHRAAADKSSTLNSNENSMSEEIEDIRELSDGEKVRFCFPKFRANSSPLLFRYEKFLTILDHNICSYKDGSKE